MSNTTLETFQTAGAYLSGHFRLTSGLHSNAFLQSALVLQNPNIAQQLGQALAVELEKCMPNGESVASPALGGLIIGHEVARAMGTRFIFTERDPEGKMTLRRGFTIAPGEKFVVVEDVVTTGGSTREVVELLQKEGAEVLAAGSIIDRSGGKADVGVPRVALVTLQTETWKQEECPLCAQGLPAVKPGSRK
ncbi:MAG: orotate phosphoribosyltransferase [Acidobacteriota bacterium]